MEESEVFTDWLWTIKQNSEDYTKQFFGVEGLNVPCISTLDGKTWEDGINILINQLHPDGWLIIFTYNGNILQIAIS